MKILYFGTFDPSYGRNWVLINGLKRNGAKVIELRRPPGRKNILKLAFDFIKLRPRFDVMIVGFSGQEVMFLVRLLTRKPIIFDAFTSHYGGYILNRKKFSQNSFRAAYYRFLDKWSCKLADVVLLESQAYIDFFVREYGLSAEKFRRIWIGANDTIFSPPPETAPHHPFRVIFFGTYVPVQGTEHMIRAASLLASEGVNFVLAGSGQDGLKAHALAKDLHLKNITFYGMLKHPQLQEEIAKSDVCLGNFGDTPLAPLIVSNKVYEALAMKKPVITSDTAANREFFKEGEALFVPLADPAAIARAITTLRDNPELRKEIAERGYRRFRELASPEVLGRELLGIIHTIS